MIPYRRKLVSALKFLFASVAFGLLFYASVSRPLSNFGVRRLAASFVPNNGDSFETVYHQRSPQWSAQESTCPPPLQQQQWDGGPLPTIYMVTPTYGRAEQIADLTRLGQTLLHVPKLTWIVVEDASKPSLDVLEYLQHSGVKHVYLTAQMPVKFAKHKQKPRGVANRNAGIAWVRKNGTEEGVVYFGDDDNTYDLRIFNEIRWTKGLSMFPVGLVTKVGVSTPIVKNGRVVGFYDGWIANRKYPVDMAGFAINIALFRKFPNASMPFSVGYEEDGILKALKVAPAQIEPKAHNCTKIWVWHTQTKKNGPAIDSVKLKTTLENTNMPAIRKLLWRGIK